MVPKKHDQLGDSKSYHFQQSGLQGALRTPSLHVSLSGIAPLSALGKQKALHPFAQLLQS